MISFSIIVLQSTNCIIANHLSDHYCATNQFSQPYPPKPHGLRSTGSAGQQRATNCRSWVKTTTKSQPWGRKTTNRLRPMSHCLWTVSMYVPICIIKHMWCMSGTAQRGGRSFKNRKLIGEVVCCESWMAEQIHRWILNWLDRRAIYLSIYLSVCLSICLSVCLSICLSVYLSVYLSNLSNYHSPWFLACSIESHRFSLMFRWCLNFDKFGRGRLGGGNVWFLVNMMVSQHRGPLNHPFAMDFSYQTYPFWIPPCLDIWVNKNLGRALVGADRAGPLRLMAPKRGPHSHLKQTWSKWHWSLGKYWALYSVVMLEPLQNTQTTRSAGKRMK